LPTGWQAICAARWAGASARFWSCRGGRRRGLSSTCCRDIDLDWDRIDVLPSDERWVPEDDPRSNAGLLRRRLLIGKAARARLVPLYAQAETPDAALAALTATVEPLLPIDVALLGMGADLHVASIFPDADRLEEALASDAPPLLPMRAPSAPEPRMSLTMPFLKGAFAVHILITGVDKRDAVVRAKDLDPNDAPVAALLGVAQVHWAE
jgi:6-phosphogluconolactonase